MRDFRPTIALLAVAATLATATADAQGYRHRGPSERGDYVVAESRFGRGTVSGPVRPGPTGWQVRLPDGTWIDCVRSCSDTLRRQTVDFWDNATGAQGKDAGRGYFSWGFGF